jgi:hypothetical protein
MYVVANIDARAVWWQVEVRLNCSASVWPSAGKVAVRTLASTDGKHFVEVGYDFSEPKTGFFVDHTQCCTAPNSIIQKANTLPLPSGGSLDLVVYVDSGLIEAFHGGRVITPLISPDVASGGGPAERVSTVHNSAQGVKCAVESFQLKY